MKNISIKLSDNEYRALKAMVDNSFSACSNSCVYPEMQNRVNADCDNCPYTIARHKIESLFD